MILAVDDDPHFTRVLEDIFRARGYPITVTHSPSAFLEVLSESASEVECVILDIMMPCGREYGAIATSHGKYTGMQMFATLRSLLPSVPVFVTTVVRDSHILEWFDEQTHCQIFLKPFDMSTLVREVEKALQRLGPLLIGRLLECPAGWGSFREYERVCADILEFLFVPPLPNLISQSRTHDGHEVRDAILLNYNAPCFWADLRLEFDARNIPCEFKNYREPIGTRDVQQVRIRLDKASLGRFGLILSRVPPAESARTERLNAYLATPKKLILFLDDETLVEMVRHKSRGNHPEDLLREQKTSFELGL
jgi:CheY-like chemotaxis protein